MKWRQLGTKNRAGPELAPALVGGQIICRVLVRDFSGYATYQALGREHLSFARCRTTHQNAGPHRSWSENTGESISMSKRLLLVVLFSIFVPASALACSCATPGP